MKRSILFAASAIALACASQAAVAGPTLDAVKKKGYVQCVLTDGVSVVDQKRVYKELIPLLRMAVRDHGFRCWEKLDQIKGIAKQRRLDPAGPSDGC